MMYFFVEVLFFWGNNLFYFIAQRDMPLLKDDKKNLAQEYVEMMESGKNVVVIKHT